jgi:signal transduction histidine kinase
VKDVLTILGLTLGACLVVGLAGAWLLHVGRRRSVRYQLTIATLVPVVAVAAAVVLNVQLMFLSSHDSVVILLALVTSLALALLGAYLVMRRIVEASAQVGAGLDDLVRDSSGGRGASVEPTEERTRAELPHELAQVVRDLAETRRTLAEFRSRERAAEQSRQELVSFMSHDLRTPLAGLRALSEGLEDGVITDVPQALSHLRSTVARMTGLVDDLFALSRVQGTAEAKRQQLVSLTEVLTDVASEATAAATARSVRLDLEVPADDRLAVLGVPEDLTRALANLVSNAVRHTDPEMAVRLQGRRAEDGRVQVAVVDGCGGIPAESLARVFDTGWRGSPSRSGDDGGAGLGLAIARGVVQSHAGSIGVRNVDGGCRFEIDLPSPAPADVPALSAAGVQPTVPSTTG